MPGAGGAVIVTGTCMSATPDIATTRRSFLRWGGAGVAATGLGAAGLLQSGARAEAAAIDVKLWVNEGWLSLQDGKRVYSLGYSTQPLGISVPGNVIQAIEGDTINVSVTNTLAERHSFAIEGVVDSGPIAPGATRRISFAAPAAGTHLYSDALNAPVNRVLGLHGVLVVMPAGAARVPYVGGPRFVREFVWVLNVLDTRWHERARLGRPIDLEAFEPNIFLINGRFGDFSSRARDTSPHGRLGEPALIRMVNVGLPVKSMHFHGNHVLVLSRNGRALDIQASKDTVFMGPNERVDVLLPFEAPGDAYPPVRTSRYPIHDHQELTQTLEGGLYPNGMLTDWALED